MILNDFFDLIFPSVCGACGGPLHTFEKEICSACLYHLPKTNFHLIEHNPVEKLFWGRVQIEKASALYYFQKEGKVQRMIHNLKYRGKTSLGAQLGELFGQELVTAGEFNGVELIIPVPLEKKKEAVRGYNQTQSFAEGLSASMELIVDNTSLKRTSLSSSQTNSSRYNRWLNVSRGFMLENKHDIAGKNVLLVDDVITTGSTLEACSRPLIEAGCKVSLLAIAFSSRS